jgi:hypothetical protein
VLNGTLQGRQHQEIVRSICSHALLGGDPPVFDVNDKKQAAPDNWRDLCVHSLTGCMAFWKTPDYEIIKGLSYRRSSELVHLTLPLEGNWLQHYSVIEKMPFELGRLASSFQKEWIAAKYQRWGFGRSMSDHGFAALFRGTGHDRLVSRRWLDFGPWRVIRKPDDTTFIQFHDLDITDPAEAYAQAAPGHERMGNSKIGGYLQSNLEPLLGYTSGLYIADEHTLEIVIGPGNQVEQREMMLACAERLQHRLEPPASNRIDHVAYIFTDRADAEAHLHELWLRELQCWYIDGHGKHRLDADYHPVPNPPAWVKKLDGT